MSEKITSVFGPEIPVEEAENRLATYETDLYGLFGVRPDTRPMHHRFNDTGILRAYLTGKVEIGDPQDQTGGVVDVYIDGRLDTRIVLVLLRNIVQFVENQVNAPGLPDDDDEIPF